MELHALALAHMTDVCKLLCEASLPVEWLHVHHPIHADCSAAVKALQQSVATLDPEVSTDAEAAKFGPDDEEAHESKGPVIADDAASSNELPVHVKPPVAMGILVPECLPVIPPRIPALAVRPVHEGVEIPTPQLFEFKGQNLFRGQPFRRRPLRPSDHCNSKLNWIQPMRVGLVGWLLNLAVSAASLANATRRLLEVVLLAASKRASFTAPDLST